VSGWYQQGLDMELATLDGTGAARAMLLDATYVFDPADEMADVTLVESAGGSYARVDLTNVTVDVSDPALVRAMTADAVSFDRPGTVPGWVVVYRDSDDALLCAIEFTDDGLDPVVITFTDDVIATRYAQPPGGLVLSVNEAVGHVTINAANTVASNVGHTVANGETVQDQLDQLDIAVAAGGGGGSGNVVNTDGLPGNTIYVGSVEPTDPPYDLQPGDLWIETDPPPAGDSYEDEVLNDGPIVLYMMADAGPGPMADTSGNAIHGTWTDDGPGSLTAGVDGPGSDSLGALTAMEWADEFGYGTIPIDFSALDTVTVGGWFRTPNARLDPDSPPAPAVVLAVQAFLDYIATGAEGTGWDYLYEGDPASLAPLLTSEGWVFISAVIARDAAPDLRVNGAPYDMNAAGGALGGAGTFEAMTLRVHSGGGSGAMCGFYVIPGALSDARRDAHYAAVNPTP
jgi:hypothetical protein